MEKKLLFMIMAHIAVSDTLKNLRYVAVLADGNKIGDAWEKCGMKREDFLRQDSASLKVSGQKRKVYQFELTPELRERLGKNEMLRVRLCL